jgi:hypothetical protein
MPDELFTTEITENTERLRKYSLRSACSVFSVVKRVGRGVSVFTAGTDFAQIGEAVDAGGVVVGKADVERIVSNQIYLKCVYVGWNGVGIERASSTPFIPASCAGAILPEILKRVEAYMAILPGDSEFLLVTNLL